MATAASASKYFAAGRNHSSSPPAFLPSKNAITTTSTTSLPSQFTSAFMSASRLLDDDTSYAAPGFLAAHSRAVPKGTANRDAKTLRTKTASKRKSIEHVEESGAKKAKIVYKSAEYILDSDESDPQLELEPTVASTSLGRRTPSITNADTSTYVASTRQRNAQVVRELASFGPKPDGGHARRRSWTPSKDTITAASNEEAAADAEAPHFAQIIGGFEYNGSDKDKPCTGEQHKSLANELPDTTLAKTSKASKSKTPKAAKSKASKPPKVPKVKVVKEPKPPKPKALPKPKKKAQTITALAMAPYAAPAAEVQAQVTIPEVLASIVPLCLETTTDQAEIPVKRKPRKRRAPEKPSKSVKPKVRSVQKCEAPRSLLPPSQAQNCLAQQTFIFGTSSQLHADESPEVLKQIRVAMEETELSPQHASTYLSPTRRSRIRVPSAPHGTSLTLGQADRELWCVAARDSEGRTLKDEAKKELDEATEEDNLHDNRHDSMLEANDEEGSKPAQGAADASDILAQESGRHHQLTKINSDVANTPIDDAELVDARYDLPESADTVAKPHNEAPLSSDSYEIISSDSAELVMQEMDDVPLKHIHAHLSAASRRFSNTAPPRVPPTWIPQRAVLQPLDANLSMRTPMTSKTSPARHFRNSTTTVQPSKEPDQSRSELLPPSSSMKENEIHTVIEINSSSPPRVTSPSQVLITLRSSPPSDWHNVDEISDSEAAAATPSPLRKLVNVSEEPITTLQFDEDAATTNDTVAGAAPSRSKKADTQWPTISAKLFPQISAAIQGIPRSDSLTNPTWHEKILLYDPIVIEDLTAWLNAQGLRVTIRRPKPRPRGKAKAKNAVTNDEHDDHEEELAHWMVQKWCEEHSICCLWKEGLRGGVRRNY